jgi:hypothetical protein
MFAAKAESPNGETFCFGMGRTGVGLDEELGFIKWAGIGDFKTERSWTRKMSSERLSIVRNNRENSL